MKWLSVAALAALALWNVSASAQGGSWEQQVRQRVAEQIKANSVEVQRAVQTLYDRRAKRGIAVVGIVVNRQGQIVSQDVVESTGILPVDGIASRLVARAAPFPPFAGGETRSIRLPINFDGRPGGRSEWERAMLRHIGQHVQMSSRLINGHGEAVLHFRVDPQGRVIAKRIAKNTGGPETASALLQLVSDASPFPAPSGARAGKTVSLSLPVKFDRGRPLFQ